MTQIGLHIHQPATWQAGGTASWSRQTGLNDALAWAIIVFVALAPIPFGSGRPFFWGVNAALVGLAALVYTLRLSQLRERFRYGLGQMPAAVTLFCLLCLYLVLQALPLGQIPFLAPYLHVATAGGAVIEPASISLAPGATWLMLLRWGTFGLFYFLVVQIAGNDRRRRLLLHAALAITTLYAIFGLASLLQFGDTILGMPKWAYEGSATATFVNRNSFATFLAFGATLACALIAGVFVERLPAEDGTEGSQRIDPLVLVYLAALAALVPALLATQSRMGVVSAAVGCVVVLLAALVRMPRAWLRVLVLVPVGLGLAALAFFVYGQNLFERLGSSDGSTLDVRLNLYQQVADMIAARPWLGYGGGSFELAYPLFHQVPVSTDLVWEKAHNSYLSLWAELGIVMGTIPIVLCVLLLFRLLSGMGRARSGWAGKAAGLGALTVAAVHSLADFSLEIEANTIMMLFITGIATASMLRSTQSRR